MKDKDRYGDASWYTREVAELTQLAKADPEEFLKKLENSGSVIFSALLNTAAAQLRAAWGLKPKAARRTAAPEPEPEVPRRRRRKKVV